LADAHAKRDVEQQARQVTMAVPYGMKAIPPGAAAPAPPRNARRLWQSGLATAIFAVALAGQAAADTATGLDALARGQYMTAIAELEPSAKAGDVRAQVNLAGIYHHGLGIAANYTKAMQWYRAAAMKGDPDGEIGLAIMYALGQGVPMDRALAHSWLTLALDSLAPGTDRDRVVADREALSREMSAEQLQQSADLVRGWYSTHRKP
jgi:TPR repeat protein